LVVAPGQNLLLGLLLGAGSQVTGRLVLAALAFHKVPGIGVLLELVELPEGQALCSVCKRGQPVEGQERKAASLLPWPSKPASRPPFSLFFFHAPSD